MRSPLAIPDFDFVYSAANRLNPDGAIRLRLVTVGQHARGRSPFPRDLGTFTVKLQRGEEKA